MRKVAEREGWKFLRQRGDHMVFEKPGNPQNLAIPDKRELGEGLLRNLLRTMDLSADEFLRLAKKWRHTRPGRSSRARHSVHGRADASLSGREV